MSVSGDVICIDSDGEGDEPPLPPSQQAAPGQASGSKGASAKKRRTPSAKGRSQSSDCRQSTLKDATPDPSQRDSGSTPNEVFDCPVCQRSFRREREAQLHIEWCLQQAERRESTQPEKLTQGNDKRERSDKTPSQKSGSPLKSTQGNDKRERSDKTPSLKSGSPLKSIPEDPQTAKEQPPAAGAKSREAGTHSVNGTSTQNTEIATTQEAFGDRELTQRSELVVKRGETSDFFERKKKDASDGWVSVNASKPKQPVPKSSKATTSLSTGKEKSSLSTGKEKSSLSTAKEKSSRLALKSTGQRKASATPATQPLGFSAHKHIDSAVNSAPATATQDSSLQRADENAQHARRPLVIDDPGEESLDLRLRGCVRTDWQAAMHLSRAWLSPFVGKPATPLPLPSRPSAARAPSAAPHKRRLSDFLSG